MKAMIGKDFLAALTAGVAALNTWNF